MIGIADAVMAREDRSRCLLHASESSWAPDRSLHIGSCSTSMLADSAVASVAGMLHAHCSEHGAASGFAQT